MANMVVSGAGTAAANGVYVENGIAQGKPKYVYGHYTLNSVGSSWTVTDQDAPVIQQRVQYRSAGAADTPDLEVLWYNKTDLGRYCNGDAPSPTVTAEGGEPEPETSIIPLAMMHYARMRNS